MEVRILTPLEPYSAEGACTAENREAVHEGMPKRGTVTHPLLDMVLNMIVNMITSLVPKGLIRSPLDPYSAEGACTAENHEKIHEGMPKRGTVTHPLLSMMLDMIAGLVPKELTRPPLEPLSAGNACTAENRGPIHEGMPKRGTATHRPLGGTGPEARPVECQLLALLGPLPTTALHANALEAKGTETRSQVKHHRKQFLCVGMAVGGVGMNPDELRLNFATATLLLDTPSKLACATRAG